MNDYDNYEIKAEAFRIMTGHMAPGKDPASATYPASFGIRMAAWKKWLTKNDKCASAMLLAFKRIMESTESET